MSDRVQKLSLKRRQSFPIRRLRLRFRLEYQRDKSALASRWFHRRGVGRGQRTWNPAARIDHALR